MMFNLVRPLLSKTLLTLDRLTSPTSIPRSAPDQAQVDLQTQDLSLYQFEGCPFCIRVRRAMKRLNLKVELRDAQKIEKYRKELIEEGGQYQTPCLRIQEQDGNVRWMYESADIINYLERRFSPTH